MNLKNYKNLKLEEQKKALFSLANNLSIKNNEAFFAKALDIYVYSAIGYAPYSYGYSYSFTSSDNIIDDVEKTIKFFKQKGLTLLAKEKIESYDRSKALTGIIVQFYQYVLANKGSFSKLNNNVYINIFNDLNEMADDVSSRDFAWNMYTILKDSPEKNINPIFAHIIKTYGISAIAYESKRYSANVSPLTQILLRNRDDYYHFLLANDTTNSMKSLVKKTLYALEPEASALTKSLFDSLGIEKEKKYIEQVVKKRKKKMQLDNNFETTVGGTENHTSDVSIKKSFKL